MKLSGKILLTSFTVLIAFAILLDPYTFSLDGSHFPQPAPLWQTVLALADLLLLALFIKRVWAGQRRPAITALGLSTTLNLLLNLGLFLRDGNSRFLMAFGTINLLPIYLGTIAIRMMMLLAVALHGKGLRDGE